MQSKKKFERKTSSIRCSPKLKIDLQEIKKKWGEGNWNEEKIIRFLISVCEQGGWPDDSL